jgi:hypothetical protein
MRPQRSSSHAVILVWVITLILLGSGKAFSSTFYVHWYNNYPGKNLSLNWYSSPPWGTWTQFLSADQWPTPQWARMMGDDPSWTHPADLPANWSASQDIGPILCGAADSHLTRDIRWKLDITPLHNVADENDLANYYWFKFDQGKLPIIGDGCGPAGWLWWSDPESLGGLGDYGEIFLGFAPGVNHIGGEYMLVRETMFIFDATLYKSGSFEQIYRRESDKSLWFYLPNFSIYGLQPFETLNFVGHNPPHNPAFYTAADIAEMKTIAPIDFAVLAGIWLLQIHDAYFSETAVTLADGTLIQLAEFDGATMVDGVLTLSNGTIIPGGTISQLPSGYEPAPEPRTIARFVQQGGKVVGTGLADAEQGLSVATSADGNTALVGGSGAAWVFTRTNGVWTQQGLLGSGEVGTSGLGSSVALSADGNTALVGGPLDNDYRGAAWVFTRTDGVWTQQGDKLVGSGAIGNPGFGFSVALSSNGNTALIGGPWDDNGTGGVWAFTRSSDVWTQQAKLVGSGAIGRSARGASVALSASGDTAIVGGASDGYFCSDLADVCSDAVGAAWIFTRLDGVWDQQEVKLVGSDAIGPSAQGSSVALSADGNTALVGGPGDDYETGAVWAFTRSNGAWKQQGNKLAGSGAVGKPRLGTSVALSGDGNTALAGGPADSGSAGATWVFTRSGSCTKTLPVECNNGIWTQRGSKLVGTGTNDVPLGQGRSVALSKDANTAVIGDPGISFTEDVPGNTTGATWFFVNKTMDLNNTPTGNIITVEPTDPVTVGTPVSLTFESVSQTGSTILDLANLGPAPPTGFAPGSQPVYYYIRTTATFSGPVDVCINYTGSTFARPPRLFHYEGNAWLDVTESQDIAGNTICGRATSFSPFALFQPVAPPAIPVKIKIRPFLPNLVIPGGPGYIPVAILTTPTFNAATVDPSTVRFGSANAASVIKPIKVDIDLDRDKDLLFVFKTNQTGIACGETTATLTGMTLSGQQIIGSDKIITFCPK